MARHGPMARIAAPARAMAQRFSVLLLIAAAIALMVLSRTHSPAVERVRMLAVDAVAPVLDVISRPVSAGRAAAERVESLWLAYQDNERLREANRRLLQWQVIARRLEQENANLRALLNLRSGRPPSYVSARVVGDTGGPFVRTMIVNAGARDGVGHNQAVVAADGLAGRIAETGERASRVLLLTDLNSRVPVVLEQGRHRAILAGDNSDRPRLIFLPDMVKVAAGERIVTSGHGGVFPRGIPVGQVAQVGEEGIRVALFVDIERLEYVTVVRRNQPALAPGSGRP